MAQPHATYFAYATPHGPVTIRATRHGIAEVVFGQVELDGTCCATALTNEAATQLQEYLAGKRREFSVAIDMKGSRFQREVWTELREIPYGSTRTAADIATALGKPGSHRSIGTAIRQNKLAPFVPSHRALAPNATGKQASIFRAFQALEARNTSAS